MNGFVQRCTKACRGRRSVLAAGAVLGAAMLSMLGGCYGSYSYVYAAPAPVYYECPPHYCGPAPVCAPVPVYYAPPPPAVYVGFWGGGHGHCH
jgi:hypothetical protein